MKAFDTAAAIEPDPKREKLRAKWNRAYWRNPERSRLRHRAARISHLEQRRKQNREWQANRKQYRAEYCQRYYLANKERLAAKARKNYEEHKERYFSYAHKRRALKRGTQSNTAHIAALVKRIKARQDVFCYYCQNPIMLGHLHFDHVFPISRGGPHSIDNICTSCDHCNMQKKAKLISEWVRVGQQLLPL